VPSEAVAVTLRVTQILDALQVLYFIGGLMASTTYSRVRATMDVDIVTDLSASMIM